MSRWKEVLPFQHLGISRVFSSTSLGQGDLPNLSVETQLDVGEQPSASLRFLSPYLYNLWFLYSEFSFVLSV